MERSNIYLFSLAVLLFATCIALILANVTLLEVYIGFFALEYFACGLIYRPPGQAYQIISATLLILWLATALLSVSGIGI
jgi:hypothetical protein